MKELWEKHQGFQAVQKKGLWYVEANTTACCRRMRGVKATDKQTSLWGGLSAGYQGGWVTLEGPWETGSFSKRWRVVKAGMWLSCKAQAGETHCPEVQAVVLWGRGGRDCTGKMKRLQAVWSSEQIWDTSEAAESERNWYFSVGGSRSKDGRKWLESVAEQKELSLCLCWQYSEISIKGIEDRTLCKGRETLKE